jgi:subtilase family serine protease
MGSRGVLKLTVVSASVSVLSTMGLAATGASSATAQAVRHPEKAVCGPPAAGHARCQVHVLERGDGVRPDASSSPSGLAPPAVQAAYGFPTGLTAGAGQTIAVVDAYDDPTIFSDLATFDAQYGLPCNSCLTKAVQQGGITTDQGWALEISLDVEWAHAIAPGAHILLVEALDSSYANLFSAEDYASANASYVSNSWGGGESPFETAYDSHFTTAGVSYFVSAGDSGLGAQYPSASPNVVSVGGTTLHFDSSGNFSSETAWSGGGGGCSRYETAAPAQSSFSQYGQVKCGGARATPDVALDADPNSGVSVYDGTPYNGQTGWWTVGGTSASSPMWAARSADDAVHVNAGYVYANNIAFRDITVGSNGASALVGYDLATGRGSWATTVVVAPPGAPSGLTAAGGAGSVSLGWSAPTTGGGVQSYNVYRGVASGGETLLQAGVIGTSYTDSSVTAGTPYFYEVTASNSGGGSSRSNEASATPTAAPDPPPTASFTKSCAGSTCTFISTSTDPDGTITSYSWSGSDGLGGSSSSTSHSYTTTGTFTVTLTVVDETGQASAANKTVTCSLNKRRRLVCS